MKKALLLLFICTLSCSLSWAQLGEGQQLQNNNFESWYTEYNSRVAPTGWHSLNSGSGSLVSMARADFISSQTGNPGGTAGNNKVVRVTCKSVWGVAANGSLTSGRFNAGNMDASNPANCTYTHSTDNNYRQALTAYPDSLYIWVRTSIANNKNARINVVIHNDNAANNTAIYQDPDPGNSAGGVVNTTGAVNNAKVVAKATWEGHTSSWQHLKLPFNYAPYVNNNTTPSYILATLASNAGAGEGKAGDYLEFDDIILIYNTRLATLKLNGTNSNINGFNEDITSYTLQLCPGDPYPTFSFTCQSSHATATTTHSPSTNEPWTTIRVTHDNQSTIHKDYTINFTITPAPSVPTVTASAADCSPVAHPVTVTASSTGATGYRWYASASATNPEGEANTTSFNVQGVLGTTTYYVSALNEAGCESGRTPVEVTIYPLPTAPTAGDATSVCSGNTGTFTVTLPAGDNLSCRWYATNNSSEIIGNGTSLQVENLTQNTTRYASTYNSVTGCESGRTAVTVNVNSTPAAPTNLVAGSQCGAGSVTLSATPASGANCQWFASETGGDALGTGDSYTTPSISSSTTYYVASYNNTGCSSARVAVLATINDLPTAPVAGNATVVCAGESGIFTATLPDGDNLQCQWYETSNSETILGTSTSLTVNNMTQNTSRYVSTYNTLTGCESGRTEVTVNVKTVPDAPSLNGDSHCGSGNITLSVNNANNEYTYTWYNANNEQVNTGTTYAIENLGNTSTFHVTATLNGCTGPSSDVIATINAIPAVPTVTDGSHCGTGTVTLSAIAGNGGNQVRWFATEEGGEAIETENSFTTPILSETTNYYVASYNSATQCIGTRQTVTATINTIPAAPVCQNDTLCGSGQAVLTAVPADNCSCQWFNANNDEITSGISNDSRTLTVNLQQSALYHVRSVDPSTNCFSESADIQAIVSTIPGTPTVSGNSRCGAGSVTLSATPGNNANTCRWYASDNTFLFEGTNFNTEELEQSTSFNCKSYNSNTGCESSGSRVVTATINPIPGTPTVNGNSPICGSGSLQLTAVPGNNATICRWIDGNDTTSSNNFSTGNISQSIDYTVQSYNANTRCASENTTVSVVVNTLPEIPQTSDDTQCMGTEVTLTATSAEHSIVRWYASAQSNNVLYEGNEFHPSNLTVGANNFYASLFDTLTQCTSANRSMATATMIDAPDIPEVADADHCGAASFTLSVINPQTNTLYKWYEAAQGETPVHEGNTFTTEVNSTTHYYVSATVSGYTCESGRKDVTITINPTPANPTITGNEAICAGQTLSVSATSDAATGFVWSDGQNSAEGENFTTPVLSESTSYTVKAYNAHCESEAVNFTVTVNPNPAAPEVSSDTKCQNQTITLGAEATNGNTCYWYATAESTDVLGSGNNYSPLAVNVGSTLFYVSQRNNLTNCESGRSIVYAIVNPTYTVNYPVVACDSFRWNNETFTASGEYTRTLSSQFGCDSVVTLQLTINNSVVTNIDTTVCDQFVWNNQTYTSTGDYEQSFYTTQNCDSTVFIHLTVKNSTTGTDHIYLCSNELPYNYNNLANITAAGTYSLNTTNAAGCDSTITLTVTVNTQPSVATNLTPAERCGEGSVILTAHAGQNGTTCRWYASEEAAEAFATGTQYTTENLSATTTYYVSSYNDYNGHPCESGRQAITATINSNPATPIVEDQVRCGNGEVEFTATIDENATTCRWYRTQGTNEILASGLSFNATVNTTTANGTTYYVESYNANTTCKSSRTPVKATAFAIPSEPELAAMSHCGPYQFSINAPANGYYKWYDSNESASALEISDNTTPTLDASRSYFISHAIDYTGISCESGKTELALAIYPVYDVQYVYDTLCMGETYTQYDLNETFSQAGTFDRTINSVSSTNCDSVVILILHVKEIKYHEFSVTACDSYSWNNENLTESDDIVRHFESSIGCDSVVTLHLTINQSVETEFSDVACDSYQWNENIYTVSGDYVQLFKTSNDCDSTVTLHLTVNHAVETEFSDIACNSYQWNDSIYTTSGDYVQLFRTSTDCDSTVTLHLTINNSNAATLTDAVCAGTQYNANGFDTTFTTAGSYTLVRHDINQANCDSTTTLILTVNPIYHQDVILTICETALPYTWNDKTYPSGTASGDYEYTFNGQTLAGCDSIVTLHLTISNQYVTPLTEHICQGGSFVFAGEERTQTGIYYDTLQAHNLCDSIVILSLTVHELNTTTLNSSICLGESYTDNGFNVTPEESGLNNYQRTVQTSYGCDSTVILNLTVNPVYRFTENVTICANELPYEWQGRQLEQEGIYTATYQTANSCDSTFTLNLTVNPTVDEPVEVSICQNELPYTWRDTIFEEGTVSGNYVFNRNTVNGCDSIVTLTLTVNPTVAESVEITICQNELPYTWRDTIFTEGTTSGEYVFNRSTVSGCDSIVTLTLTVNPTADESAEITICQNELPFTWRDTLFAEGTVSGEYVFNRSTMNGCDSTVTLHLTVNPTTAEFIEATICQNDLPYTWRDTIFEEGTVSGDYIFNKTTANGCDSIVTLTLTVNESKHTDIYQSICSGEYFEYNDEFYEVTDDYDIAFQTSSGCDSIVTLHLTVNPVYNIDTNITICQGMIPYNFADTIFYGSGNKDILLHTQHGCDSIYHVRLNVTPYTTASQTITVCDNELPYQFQDSTFYAAGIYDVTETSEDGCDRITTVTLIVNPTYDTTIYVTECGSYTLDRGIYQSVLTESGIYIDTLPSISGCDSIVRLNLTINPLKKTLLSDAICLGDNYAENGFYIQTLETGMVYDTLHLYCANTGCDSTVYLELTVNPAYYLNETDIICQNDLPYTWRDTIFAEGTVSGDYIFSKTTTNGCDSIVTLTLTVNPSFNQSENETICQSELPYTWRDTVFAEGTVNGEYVFNRRTVNGCDSIVTLTLTVNPTYSQTESETICANELPYTWRDTIFTEGTVSGDYVFNKNTVNGCDSIVTLTLTVNHVFNQTESETICQNELPYTWRDTVFAEGTVSGDFVFNKSTANGCDSTVTLSLTINPTYSQTESETICANELPYSWRDTVFAEGTVSGDYVFNRSTLNGCDSTVTLSLTVNPSYNQNESETICQAELPYTWRDTIFAEGSVSGDYTFHRTTMNQCDSIVTLHLTINPNNEYYDDPVSICEGDFYEWNNQIITESGTYTDTVTNNYNCYDVYKIVVTVNPVYQIDEYDTVCSNELPIIWQGRTISYAGITTVTYQSVNYCDSTYRLFLTVYPDYFYEDTATTCDNEAYVWEGHEHIQIGLLTEGKHIFWDNQTTSNGCDSIYKLTLNVTPTFYTEETATTCANEAYVWEGHNVQIGLLEAGTYTIWDSLSTNTYNCDSVYKLTLTVTPSFYEENTGVTCANEAYVWEGHEHIQIGLLDPGVHIIWDSLTTDNYSCDSVYKLILTVNQTAHSIETVSSCSNEDILTWHNIELTATGIYYDTLETALNCDSVCELHFTLYEPTAAVFTDTTCANALYQAYGFEFTPFLPGDTTLVRIIDNIAGCDSTISLNLYVKPVATFSFDTIVCGAFNWNNQWYTESGSYPQTFTAANGCDSIVTVNLTIDTPAKDTIEVTACESYEWNGVTYAQSGTYSKVFPQAVGCDSTAVLILTINHSTEVFLYDTTCLDFHYQGSDFDPSDYPSILANLLYTHYQEYGFDTLIRQTGTVNLQRIDTNAMGCDSIINVMLTVPQSYLSVDSASTCDNEDFVWQGMHCNSEGIYVKSYPTIHGCDSAFILLLTVNPSYEVSVTDSAIAGTPYHNHGLNFTPQTPGTLNIDVPRTTVDGCDSIVHVTLIVANGNSIDMHYLDHHIKLYPNPTENVFTVNSTIDIIRELTIYDNNGKEVLQQNINDYSGQVNVEHLAPGIYFVRLLLPENVITKKLIIR